MHLYNAHIDGVELDTLILARSGSHAAEIFLTFYAATHGTAPGNFEILRSELPKIPILGDLHQLAAGHASGVILFDEHGDFRLEPM